MNKSFLLLIKKKNIIILGLIPAIFILYSLSNLLTGEKISPEQLINDSVQKILTSNSFRYYIEIKSESKGIISQVDGEWIAPNRSHLKGTMYHTPVEIIRIGKTIYMKDIWTKKWFNLKNGSQIEQYIAELGPLSFLNFKNVSDIKYLGKEKLKEGKMHLVECKPDLPKEYKCKLWINSKEYFIHQVIFYPTDTDKELPYIIVKFRDYGHSFLIKPPENKT